MSPVDVERWAREVVARRAAAVLVVTTAVHIAVVLGLPARLESTIPAIVGGAIDFLGLVVTVLWARSGVTPADPALDPRATSGAPLVPSGGGR